MPEFMSALEMAMDIVAHKMGMDPWNLGSKTC